MTELRLEPSRVLHAAGRLSFLKNGEDGRGSHAYSASDALKIRLLLPRQAGITSLFVHLRSENDGKEKELLAAWEGILEENDVYTVVLPQLPAGLYRFRLTAESAVGHVTVGRKNLFDELSLLPYNDESYPFQILISDFQYKAPEWIYGGIIYHVFVDRFFRAGYYKVREDAILNEDWENGIPQYPAYPGAPLANNMFFGGDLDGVREKLDYLLSLGVSCIYLSPIFEAASNHKYDTGDYMKVDEMFGGDEAFSRLLFAAHEKGMRVILDGVFNHTGADSRYFNRYGRYTDSVGAYQSKASPYFAWYDFQEFPNKYTAWWDIEILPRLVTDNEECRSFFLSAGGVIDRWMKFGIDGFRLDVVDELSDAFVSGIKARMDKTDKQSILYGEVWEDASNKEAYGRRRAYYDGNELDGVMNYPLRTGLIRYFRYGDTDALLYALTDIIQNAPKRIRDAQMNLLGTHDTERILTAISAEERGDLPNDVLAVKRMTGEQRELGIRRLSLAYLVLATLPGVPSIFYADEVGLEGYGDPFNRLPFPWHQIEEGLLETYRRIGALRRRYGAYKNGEFRLFALTKEQLVFARDADGYSLVTVINRGDKELSITLPLGTSVLYGPRRKKNAFTLPSMTGAVLRLPRGSVLVFNE